MMVRQAFVVTLLVWFALWVEISSFVIPEEPRISQLMQTLSNDSLVRYVREFEDGLFDIESSVVRLTKSNILLNSQNVSVSCANDMSVYITDFLDRKLYAMQMFSSNGKISKDFAVTGSVQDIGTFEQCLAVEYSAPGVNIDGRYCLVGVRPVTQRGGLNSSTLIEDIVFRFGFCVPDSCEEDDVTQIIEEMATMSPDSWNVEAEASCIKDKSMEAGTIATLCVIVTFLLLVTISTIYDVTMRATLSDMRNKRLEKPPPVKYSSGWKHELFVNFSLLHNGRKILNTELIAFSRIIGSLRVFFVGWLILRSINNLMFITNRESFIDNPKGFLEVAGRTLPFMVFWNSGYAADSMLVTFGAVQAYFTLKTLRKAGTIRWIPYFIKHIWFFIWAISFMSLVTIFIIKYVQGPYWNIFYDPKKEKSTDCWWSNLLFINNFVPFPGALHMQCMGWTWFQTCQVQLFILTTPIVVLLNKSWKAGMVAIATVIIGCSCITAYLATYYGHNPSRAHEFYNDNYLTVLGSSEYDLLFDKPWFRWPSFISGTVAGYLIVIYQEKPFKLPWYCVLLGWSMSVFMAITALYGIWGSYLGEELSQEESVFYITYSHTAWAIAIAWVPFACLSGNGGMVNAFLQWKFFIPFGRLTYNWYIIHPPLVAIYYYTLNRLFFYTNYTFVYLCISTLILIKAVAFLLHILIDCPMQGIWEIIERRLQKKSKYQ